jgi:hypothetical protein
MGVIVGGWGQGKDTAAFFIAGGRPCPGLD